MANVATTEQVGIKSRTRILIPIGLMVSAVGFFGLAAFSIISQIRNNQLSDTRTEEKSPVSQSSQANRNNRLTTKAVAGEILVQFRPERVAMKQSAGHQKVKSFSVRHNLEILTEVPGANVASFRVRGLTAAAQQAKRLQSDADVILAQPNFQYQVLTNDPLFGDQWYLKNTGQIVDGMSGTAGADIDAELAWVASPSGATTTVAVIDTGVAYTHPDLATQMWDGTACVDDANNAMGGCIGGFDFEDNDKNPGPTNPNFGQHGTMVSGVIAATQSNSIGISGIAPNARIMGLKTILNTLEIIRAIRFAQYNGAKIINASWGGPVFDPLMAETIEDFSGLFVAAAGNYGDNHNTSGYELYPCDYSFDNVLCVAATNSKDELSYFSDFSPTSVDMGAPGENILTTSPTSAYLYEYFNGVTQPNLPVGWSKTGEFGTRESDFSISSLYGDATNLPYAANANSTATSPVINLSNSVGTWFVLDTSCDTEYSDGWSDYMALELPNLPIYKAPVFGQMWGSQGSGQTQFSSPTDTAIDEQGNIYVADNGNNRISKFQSNGTYVTSWGTAGSGDGQFTGPKEIVADRQGNIYVLDSGNGRIQKFLTNGTFVTKWTIPGGANNSMAIDAAGYVYVLNRSQLRVDVYNNQGTLVKNWASQGTLSAAEDLAVDIQGYVYVTFPTLSIVRMYDNDGNFYYSIGNPGTGLGRFQSLSGIAVDAQKNVYVGDPTANTIQVFNQFGFFIATLGGPGSGQEQFSSVAGIGVNSTGALVMVDKNNHRIQKYAIPAPTPSAGFQEAARWDERRLDDDLSPTGSEYGAIAFLLPDSMLNGSFQYQLRWVSNGSDSGSTGDGCNVDYVTFYSWKGGSAASYNHVDGTSFSSPAVAAAAAFLWGANPTLTVAQVKNILMTTGDTLPELQGQTVSGKRLNLYRAVTYQYTAVLSGAPSGSTTSGDFTITVGGGDVVSYKTCFIQGAGSCSWGSETPIATPITLSNLGESDYTLEVIGKASNGTWQALQYPTRAVWKVDRTSPTATISYSNLNPTIGYVIATLVPSESVTVTNNGGLSTKYFYSNGNFTFNFSDLAGHVGSATATVQNIDKVAPTATISYSTTSPTAGSVIATLNPSETVIVIGNGGSRTRTFTQNEQYLFYFRDTAGNFNSALATVANILPAPTASIAYNPLTRTVGPVTATITIDEPGSVTNNGALTNRRFYQNSKFTFRFASTGGKTNFLTANVTSITVPSLTQFLKVDNGKFAITVGGKRVTLRPFGADYRGAVIGKKIQFASLGTYYVFAPYAPYGKGSLKVYNQSGKLIVTLVPPNDIATQGLNVSLTIYRSYNRVFLAVGANGRRTTATIYEIKPNGVWRLQTVTAGPKTLAGRVNANFLKLDGEQVALVTMINRNPKTIKVWQFDGTKNLFVQDKTYSDKHFTVTSDTPKFEAAKYKPKFSVAGGPVISDVTISQPASGLATINWKVDRQSTNAVNWGPSFELGYDEPNGFGSSALNHVHAVPVQSGVIYHYRIKACANGNCTMTPDKTWRAK